MGLQEAISEILSTSEIVEIEIPTSVPEIQHPGFGMFRDDPTFDEFIGEVTKYRQAHNTTANYTESEFFVSSAKFDGF